MESNDQHVMSGLLKALTARWLWYSILAIAGWSAWAILLKIGSTTVPTKPALFLQNAGMIPLAIVLALAGALKGPQNRRGIIYSLLNGAITGVGILFLLAAYRRGGNTSVVAVTSSLYPLVTLILAGFLLREKLTRSQTLGVILATVSVVLFSL